MYQVSAWTRLKSISVWWIGCKDYDKIAEKMAAATPGQQVLGSYSTKLG